MIIGSIYTKGTRVREGLDVVITREEAVWLNDLFKRLLPVEASELLHHEEAEIYEKDQGYREAVQQTMLHGIARHLVRLKDQASLHGRNVLEFVRGSRPGPYAPDRVQISTKLVVLKSTPMPPYGSKPDHMNLKDRNMVEIMLQEPVRNAGIHFPDSLLEWGKFE